MAKAKPIDTDTSVHVPARSQATSIASLVD